MNRKQFLLVLIALLLIGGAGLTLMHHEKKTWAAHELKVGDKLFPNFAVNDVADIRLFIKAGFEFNVVRSNGNWYVPERFNYPANFRNVSDLLLKMKDLKIVQSDIVGQSLLGHVYLNENDRIQLEFKNAQGKVLNTLYVGKKHDRQQKDNEPMGIHGFWDGRYVLLPDDTSNVLLVSDDLSSVIPDVGSWLDPEFFKVENIKFISKTSPNPDESWSLMRETLTSPWILADAKPGESVNNIAASQPAEMMEFPRFSDIVPNTPPYSTNWGLDHPTIVNIMADSLAYTMKIGDRSPDGHYHLTVSATGNIPTTRTPAPDESPADKERLDEDFAKKTKELQAKLAKAQTFSSWIFNVDDWVDMVARPRAKLFEVYTPTDPNGNPLAK